MRVSRGDRDANSTYRPSPVPLDVNRHALFLDLDGTLIEIEERPDAIVADELLLATLRQLSLRTRGAVAIISGRTIPDVGRIIQGAVDCISGLHGIDCQVAPGVNLRAGRPSDEIDSARFELSGMAASGELNAIIEDKGKSIALHYRHAPENEQSVFVAATSIASRHDLRVLRGKMVVELMAGERTKGDAVIELMDYARFVGRTPIAMTLYW